MAAVLILVGAGVGCSDSGQGDAESGDRPDPKPPAEASSAPSPAFAGLEVLSEIRAGEYKPITETNLKELVDSITIREWKSSTLTEEEARAFLVELARYRFSGDSEAITAIMGEDGARSLESFRRIMPHMTWLGLNTTASAIYTMAADDPSILSTWENLQKLGSPPSHLPDPNEVTFVCYDLHVEHYGPAKNNVKEVFFFRPNGEVRRYKFSVSNLAQSE